MALTKVVNKAITTISVGWDLFNDLIDDLASTDNGLGSSCIGVEDSAGYFTAATVEAVLAELYTGTLSAVNITAVFDEESSTTTGLTWGYKAGTFVYDGVVYTVVAGTVSLTDDATNYIEIDPTDQTVKRNTTAFTSGRIPLRKVVAASGAQTSSTDFRTFFTFTSFDGNTINGDITVKTSTGSGGTADTDKDNIVVDSNTAAGITVLANDGNSASLALGHASDVDSLEIDCFYSSGDPWARFVVGGKTAIQVYSAGGDNGMVVIGDSTQIRTWDTGYDSLMIGDGAYLYGTPTVTGISNNAYRTSSVWKYAATDEATLYELAGAGGHYFYTAASGTEDDTITFANPFKIVLSTITRNAAVVDTFNTLADDATPSVAGGSLFLTGGTTTITDFDDGVTGQIIEIHAGHTIQITHGTNIYLNGAAHWTMAAGDTLTLRCRSDNKWYEVARSDNT